METASAAANEPVNTQPKPRVLVTRRLPEQAQRKLESLSSIELIQCDNQEQPIPREKLLEQVRGVRGALVLLTDKVDEKFLDAAGPSLKVVSTMSVGYDHIDVTACKQRGVRIGYTPDVLTDATADLTVGLLLATARRFPEAMAAVKEGKWGIWNPVWMCGTGLSGKTVGIVGLGRIGLAVAERLQAFKIGKLLYTGRTPKPPSTTSTLTVPTTFVSMDTLLTSSDIIIITCALTPQTHHLFNSSTFSKMKRTALLINTARGPIINQDDLIVAMKTRLIRGAGLDVTDPEPLPVTSGLLECENCVVLPHVGSADVETREAMAGLAVENLVAGVGGMEMPAEVV
ncbi:hypothetical protein HK102_000248 [Quaeritorhiza haematococci]|nr:hypothetical protein HK102_000248 [Quaeritorhiza haematococci]